jgi:hypothetical protein
MLFIFILADLLWDLVQSASFVCMQSILLFGNPLPRLVTKFIYIYNLISFILFFFILGHHRLSLAQNKFVEFYLIVD